MCKPLSQSILLLVYIAIVSGKTVSIISLPIFSVDTRHLPYKTTVSEPTITRIMLLSSAPLPQHSPPQPQIAPECSDNDAAFDAEDEAANHNDARTPSWQVILLFVPAFHPTLALRQSKFYLVGCGCGTLMNYQVGN
jgi:hypothetical protein